MESLGCTRDFMVQFKKEKRNRGNKGRVNRGKPLKREALPL